MRHENSGHDAAHEPLSGIDDLPAAFELIAVAGILQNVPRLVGCDVFQPGQHRIRHIRTSVRKTVALPFRREFDALVFREEVELRMGRRRQRQRQATYQSRKKASSFHRAPSKNLDFEEQLASRPRKYHMAVGTAIARPPADVLCGKSTSSAASQESAMTSARTSHVRWFLVFWLFILSAVSYLDRVNISIAGGSIAEAYHLSDVQLGKVFSAMLVGYALFQTVGGRLADRFGPRRVLAAGVTWWGIFTALTALVPANIAGALFIFVAVRFLLGAGEAVIYPSANQFIARWIPTSERGIANGWIFAGVGAGAGLTPLLITYIMVHYGWRSSFWVCSIIGFAAGAVWFLSARDTPCRA